MPPIGFAAPPDTASPSAVLWIAVLALAATLACALSIAAYDAIELIATPRPQLSDAQLFPKDGARVVDANGNDVRAR
jgi:hypothetical protein